MNGNDIAFRHRKSFAQGRAFSPILRQPKRFDIGSAGIAIYNFPAIVRAAIIDQDILDIDRKGHRK